MHPARVALAVEASAATQLDPILNSVLTRLIQVLRVLDSLQLTAKHSVATPVNWKHGEKVIIVPSISDEAAKEKFPKGYDTFDVPSGKKYIRVTPQPNV